MSEITFIAVDDGSGNIASMYINDAGKSVESMTPSGIVNRLLADGGRGISDRAWVTESGHFTVNHSSIIQVNTCTKEYQLSEANRVLVHDCIARSTANPVYLAVTLPTSQFYTGDDENPIDSERIEMKRKNLMRTVTNYSGAYQSPNVLGVLVFPESIPAYVYCVYSAKNQNDYPDNHLTLVVDLGRYTCDIALIGTDYQVISFSTTESGVYKLTEKLRQLITRNSSKLNINDASSFSDNFLNQIIDVGYIGSVLETEGAISARKDVSHLIAESKEYLSKMILSDMKAVSPDFSTLTRVVFVGGGANWLADLAESWHHTVTIPEQPEMAIVRGTHLMLIDKKEQILRELKKEGVI